MQVPELVRNLLDAELRQLAISSQHSITPRSRREIYEALGPSSVTDERILDEARENNTLPILSAADRVRARIALSAARKVEGLWSQACLETEANFTERQDPAEIWQEEETYLALRSQKRFEQISVYEVPRKCTPTHILEMAELVLRGEIRDPAALRQEANEWWQIYGRPEEMEREYFIKWAAQDALYQAIGWINYESAPPGRNALYAFAGIFEGVGADNRKWTLDESKQREFWIWWLTEAIPQAAAAEGG
jgi:hypothetical protein